MRRGHVKSIACIVEGWARIPSGAVPHACQTMHTVSRPTAAFSTGGREIPSMRDSGFLAAASWSVVRADSQFIGPGTIVQGARRRGVLPALAGAANPRGVRGMGAISRGPSKELLPYDRAPEDGAGPSTDDSLLEKQVADGPAGDQNTVGAGQRPRNVGPVSARVLALPLPGGSAEGARTSPERMFTRFVETMRGFAPRNWTTILREVAAHSPNHARTLLRVQKWRERLAEPSAVQAYVWEHARQPAVLCVHAYTTPGDRPAAGSVLWQPAGGQHIATHADTRRRADNVRKWRHRERERERECVCVCNA